MNISKIIDSQQKEIAESQIREARKTIDYNSVQFPLEYFIDRITQQQIDSLLKWNESKQSYFIESLMLGLPVLNIVFREKAEKYRLHGIDEVEQLIDGKQRLLTALNFLNSNLRLFNLKEIDSLNGFTFRDLPLSRQKKFRRISVRAIAINPKSDLSVWKECQQHI